MRTRGRLYNVLDKAEPVQGESPGLGIGKPFDQLYDANKVTPLPEWQSINDGVWQEFETECGLKL